MGKPTQISAQNSPIVLIVSRVIFFTSLFLFVSTSTLLVLSKITLNSPTLPKPPIPLLFPSSQTTTISFVHDGDTIYSQDIKAGIRLIGINAPEVKGYTSQTDKCGALESTEKLKNLILGKQVVLVEDKLDKVDAYGRLLRYVYLCRGDLYGRLGRTQGAPLQNCTDINLEMLKSGLAEENAYRKKFEKEKEYIAAQKTAKENKLGNWKICKD